MAASSTPGDMKSVGYGQDYVKVQCNLCDTDNDVTSYCTNCLKNMCVKCKQIHDRLLADHKIITVFEGRIIKHFNTKCQTHDLVFLYYCENCQKNICNKCLTETHGKCNLVDINKHTEMLKTSFTKTLDKQRQHLPEINKRADSIKDHLTNFDNIIKNQISLIETETEKRHKDLDARKLDLIKKLKYQQESVHKTLHDQIQTLQDLKTSIDEITTSIKTQIDLVPDAGVLQLVNEGNTKLANTSINTTFELPNSLTFTPSALWDQGNNPLGSLENTDSYTTVTIDTRIDHPDTSNDLPDIKSPSLDNADNTTFTIDTRVDPPDTRLDLPDTKSPSPAPSLHHSTPADPSPSLRHEISVVRQLSVGDWVYSCTSDGSTCWVGCLCPSTVKLYNQRGDQLLSVRLSHRTDYTALTTTGKVLVSGDYTTVISRVNKTGQVRKFTDISARDVGYVTGLVTTREDDVFVCVKMEGKTKDKVLTFSARGKNISELNSHFFTSTKLYGIHAVSRDTFCVLDGEGREGGRLVFVDGSCQLVRHIDRTTKELQSNIRAVAGDRHGHLIIATGEYIHVLSGDGTCKRTYHIQGSGRVEGVSVGEDDVLWIGTGTYTGTLTGFMTGKLIVAKYLE